MLGRPSEAVTKLVPSAEADSGFPTSLPGTHVPGYLAFAAARLVTDLSHRIGLPMSFVTGSSGRRRPLAAILPEGDRGHHLP
jgi:hypothetical protein